MLIVKIIRQFIYSLLLFLALLFWFCLPEPLFLEEPSDILLASDSTLLGARIASDGQWRFPETEAISEKIEQSILAFEDKRFYSHPGIDLLAVGRAFVVNIRNRRIVSGGSTLTMQLVRLSRKGRRRTFFEKAIEMVLALRIELAYSKQEILALYLSHAPFGGNTVGIETAAWRYYSRPVSALSWAESATLAVLPNAPALIHPGRNRDQLQKKRDRLLARLRQQGVIDEMTYQLSVEEPIPLYPSPLPVLAPHLLDRLRKEGKGGRLYTTLDFRLQQQALDIVNRYSRQFRTNHIYNLAVLVADISTGHVLAYVGNPTLGATSAQGMQVDMITAERSTGSLLKPLLYAGMLDAGHLLPTTLVPDIPLYVNGFAPQNYNKEFRGAVHADEAISRSLNVPLVRMLMNYDSGRFYNLLKKCGMNTLHQPADHYGLSLILGGAEGSLWNMTAMYASLARFLNNESHDVTLQVQPSAGLSSGSRPNTPFSRASLWFAVDAMSRLNRPEEESEWQSFAGMKKIAWKTGTSYGARDAWAIGFTPRYAVGVWVGNASGEGRAGLSGVEYAAPVLFDLFSHLPSSGWFSKPEEEMCELSICSESGYKSGPYCDQKDTLLVPVAGKQTGICPFHRQINLDETASYRVTGECYPLSKIVRKNWFVLPPAQEWYYRHYNATYQPLPPVLPGCDEQENRIDLIYPQHNMRIYLPVGFSGKQEKFVFKAAHSRPGAVLFWHINDLFYGETTGSHQLAVSLPPGEYLLTLVDETGYSRKIIFSVVGKTKQSL